MPPVAIVKMSHVVGVCCLMGLPLFSLLGCADPHWSRMFYEGARYGAEQCPFTRKPADAPCSNLPAYDRYEQDRARVKNEARPTPIMPVKEPSP